MLEKSLCVNKSTNNACRVTRGAWKSYTSNTKSYLPQGTRGETLHFIMKYKSHFSTLCIRQHSNRPLSFRCHRKKLFPLSESWSTFTAAPCPLPCHLQVQRNLIKQSRHRFRPQCIKQSHATCEQSHWRLWDTCTEPVRSV